MLLWEYLDDRCWIAAEYSIKFKYFFVTNAHRIIKGEKLLKNYLNDINVDAKTKVMKKQIDIVGGCQHIYEIVNKNLKKGLIEFSLLKETCDLYSWRKSYFNKNLSVKQGAWFTNSYYINTMTYQITKNFEQVVDICCSNLYLNQNGNNGLYFEVKEDLNWRGIIDIIVKDFQSLSKTGMTLKNIIEELTRNDEYCYFGQEARSIVIFLER